MNKIKTATICLIMGLGIGTPWAFAQSKSVKRCVDASGNVKYSNSNEAGFKCETTNIEKKGMQILNHGGTGFAPQGPITPSSASSKSQTTSNVSIPKINKEEQKRKDVNRISILENELKDEIESINKIEKTISTSGTDSKKINELSEIKARHMQNIKSLQREIDLQSKNR